jgi:hypothetical protein
LRICLGYHAADPSLRIGLLLNGATPAELADCCPFIERSYAVEYVDFLGRVGDPDAALAGVPPEWDYVVDNWRAHEPEQLRFEGVRLFFDAARRHFRARVHHGIAGAEPPSYRPHCSLRLELPAEARGRARRELADAPVRIAVMPAGSSEPSRYPSPRSWQLILGALVDEFPGAVFCLVGKLERDGRTATSLSAEEVGRIAAVVPRSFDSFDRPLLEQLAFVEACDVFVSPHTGFGTAALAVGTPWLTLSGGPWHESFFNGVPFYSVLPDKERFPCFTWDGRPPTLVEDDGPRTPSMSRARIEDDLPELLEAAHLLIERRLPYEEALGRYFPRLLDAYRGDRSRIFSFDSIHTQYI